MTLPNISTRAVTIVGVVLVAAFLLWGLLNWIERYGDQRQEAGVQQERAAWEEANRKIQTKVIKAQDKATEQAVIREANYAEAVAEEREKIDEAVAENRSPLDVLFGN
jgi:hypothetical protein